MNLNQLPGREGVFICGHLARKERRIQYVFHSDDGELSMIYGWDDCDVDDAANCKIAGLQHLLEYDTSLRKITHLPAGFEAWHDENDDWVFTPLPAGGNG